MKKVIMIAAFVVGGASCETAEEITPEDACRQLVGSFLQKVRAEDYDGLRPLLAKKYWVDWNWLRQEPGKDWPIDWGKLTAGLRKSEITETQVFALPAFEEWSEKGRMNYGWLHHREETNLRVADLSFKEGRGFGLICGRGRFGWRILGIDDNKIGERLGR